MPDSIPDCYLNRVFVKKVGYTKLIGLDYFFN